MPVFAGSVWLVVLLVSQVGMRVHSGGQVQPISTLEGEGEHDLRTASLQGVELGLIGLGNGHDCTIVLWPKR